MPTIKIHFNEGYEFNEDDILRVEFYEDFDGSMIVDVIDDTVSEDLYDIVDAEYLEEGEDG